MNPPQKISCHVYFSWKITFAILDVPYPSELSGSHWYPATNADTRRRSGSSSCTTKPRGSIGCSLPGSFSNHAENFSDLKQYLKSLNSLAWRRNFIGVALQRFSVVAFDFWLTDSFFESCWLVHRISLHPLKYHRQISTFAIYFS
jgi:hypothetical protein